MEDKITVEKERDTFENRVKIVLRSMHNNIGEFSNYASAYHNRCPQTEEQKKKYESYIDIIAVVTGKSIDHAKTGIMYYPPTYISKYAKPLPYFMKYRGATYARQKLSKSMSNMNRLCIDLEKWNKEIRWKRSSNIFDYSIMKNPDVQYTDKQFNAILEIYKDYCKTMQDLGKFQNACRNPKKHADYLEAQDVDIHTAKNFEVDWGVYFDDYRNRCTEACPDKSVLANIVVDICCGMYPKRDKKFMWLVSADGIIGNIKQVGHKLPMRDDMGIDWYMGKNYSWVDYEGE